MTFELFWQIWLLFAGLFVIGTLACLPLYDWHINTFLTSKLWTKIYWWLPIFIGLNFVLWFQFWAALVIVIGLVAQASREFFANRAWRQRIAILYGIIWLGAIVQLLLYHRFLGSRLMAEGLIQICFASVLSDVFAFFAGSYVGKHSLPRWINSHKSWEGVAGQLLGAIVGLGLVSLLPSIAFSWSLALAIGCASTVGDLLNSIAKRGLAIKDWGNSIPGHGGVLDRFSSLAFAIAAGLWLLH